MKYIFVAGAPGSKWSSVVKNIYYSQSIDQSDYSEERTYYHDAGGETQLMHLGAYFDPGMEFGDFFDKLSDYTKEECEAEFDKPFSGPGVRIIKSHVFSHHIDFIKENWPECPLILVHRPDDACLGWWVKCGHFDITHPTYDSYYKDLRTMSTIISNQNADIVEAWGHDGIDAFNNVNLADACRIVRPAAEYHQDYRLADIRVKVL